MTVGESLVTFKVGQVVGWVDVRFHIDGKTAEAGASYLSDPLGDLVRLALLAVTGANEAYVTLDGEGAEWRVEFAAISLPEHGKPGLMQFTLRDAAGIDNDDRGVLFRGDCATRDFAADVLREAVSVRDAYVARWQHEACPPAAIHALKAALDFLA